MVKLIEQVINAVILNKPNRTDRLGPKGKEVGQRVSQSLCVDNNTSGGQLEPKLSKVNSINRETPTARLKRQDDRKEIPWVSGPRNETKSERLSVMDNIGDEKIALW